MAQLTTKEVVALVEIGNDRLAQIEQGGWIKRAGRNRWPATETLAGLVRFYRDENRRGPKSEADARLKDARAEQIALKTKLLAHELVPTDEFLASTDMIVGRLISHLVSVPARCTRDLQLRQIIEREINLARTAAADEMDRQGQALTTTGSAAPPR
jgi:phage terminase Nu1 subunit (DNA packaging protein)